MLDEKINKNRSKHQAKLRYMLGWILDGSWIDFGSILGGFWGPSWTQNLSKIDTKSIWKGDRIFDRKWGGAVHPGLRKSPGMGSLKINQSRSPRGHPDTPPSNPGHPQGHCTLHFVPQLHGVGYTCK